MKDMKKKAKIIMRRGFLHFLQALHGEILLAFFAVRVHPCLIRGSLLFPIPCAMQGVNLRLSHQG